MKIDNNNTNEISTKEAGKMPEKQKKQIKILIIAVIVILLISIVAAVVVNSKETEDTAMGDQTTVTREVSTAAPGDEYEYTENGKKFKVTPKGTFVYNDQYGWIVYYEFNPIPVYRTYTYNYDNGTKCTLKLNNDDTYELTSEYPNGLKDVLKGHAEIINGFNDSINAMKTYNKYITDVDSLAYLFKTTPENLDPNNIYHVKLVDCTEAKHYQNGEEITFADSGEGMEDFDYDEEENNEDVEFLIDEFVIYLSKVDPEQTDENGKKYYEIDCLGYNVRASFLWAPWTGAGEMTASGYYYVE